MSRWGALAGWAKVECIGYVVLALAGLIGTQVALVALLRETDGGLAAAVWGDLTMSPTTVFATIDLVVVFFAAVVFMVAEALRVGLPWWGIYLVLSVAVAVSVGLPLFLLARRLHLAGEVGPRTS